MKNYKVLTVLAGLWLIALSACEDKDTIILPGQQQNQLRVIGTATIKRAPDIATAYIGVQTISKEVEAAVAENNEKSSAVIEALRQQGVAEEDIQTSFFNISPQRDYNKPNEIIGFQVDNTISVIFRDLDNIGKGLQSAITAGANNISGISFSIADLEPLRSEARTKAIQDARQQAESIAKAAEIELGKIISINETVQGPITPWRSYDKAVIESQVPIQPGELEITVQVELVYAIL